MAKARGRIAVPVQYYIHPDLRLTVVKYAGDVTVRDNVDCFLEYIRDPLFDPDYTMLVDQPESTLTQADFNQMHLLSSLLRPYYDARNPAALTGFYCPEDVLYGVTRMYLMISESKVDRPVGVFRTREECLEFLGFERNDSMVNDTVWPSAPR